MGRAARTKQAQRVAAGREANPTTPRPERPRKAGLPPGYVHVDMPPETMREVSAMHEAAHAVVAHSHGIKLGHVTIEEEMKVRESGERAGYDLVAACTHDIGTPLENARVAVAGWIQERVVEEHLGIKLIHTDGRDNDQEHFQTWCVEAAGSVDGGKAIVDRVLSETIDILDRLNVVHVSLAKALFVHGRLEEPEVLAILGPYPDVSPDTLAEREATRAKLSTR